MNPWYVHLVDDCLAEHDRVCLEGAECPEREAHTTAAYVYVALRERVEALQGQVAHAESRIKAVRDALDGYGKPTDRIGGLPDAIRRALDGEQ